MDTGLLLRMKYDKNESMDIGEINKLLFLSKVVKKRTKEFIPKPMFDVWRIIALSEIPYTIHLEYTKNVVMYIERNMVFEVGFSLNGKKEDFFPCYNTR